MERKKVKTKVMALAICVVLLASISGVVSAQISTTALTTQTEDSRAIPAPPVLPGSAIDQQQTTSSGATYMGSCYGHPWQSFVPSQPVLAGGAIHIEFDNPTNCEELTMHIRTSPSGSDLTSVAIPKSEIVVGEWAVFDFLDISVTPGETYYIVLDDEGGVSYYGWSIRSEDVYPPGEACTNPEHDWTFVTYYPGITPTPTISISTDSFEYTTGDTMTVTLDIANPTIDPVAFEWYIGVPQLDIWVTYASAPIPAGFDNSYTIPIPVGDWGSTPFGLVHYVHMLDPVGGDVLVQDVALCAYSPGVGEAMPVDIEEEIKKTVEKIW